MKYNGDKLPQYQQACKQYAHFHIDSCFFHDAPPG